MRTGITEPEAIIDLVGRKIGASGQGTSARAMSSIEGVHIPITEGESTNMLLRRLVDAWIVDEFDAVTAARESNGRLRVLTEGIATEQYGFVFAGENRALQESFDVSIGEIIDNGAIENLHGPTAFNERWTGLLSV